MKLSMNNGTDGEGSFIAAPYTTIIQKLGRCIWGDDTSVPIFEIWTPGTDKKKMSVGFMAKKVP